MISEREKLEFESLPEFVREPRTTTRESYSPRASYSVESNPVEPSLPKSAELEALWPGVNHDFLHTATQKKGPSFYLTIGFMAGAVVSLIGVFSISAISQFSAKEPGKKEIVVAQGAQRQATQTRRVSTTGGAMVTTVVGSDEPEIIVPLSSSYEVGDGDTLAAIALKNYRRATPRLLDEICRANGMRNANVLSLGQKLALPEYRPQRIATGGNSVQQ